jgi:hypothetical protein
MSRFVAYILFVIISGAIATEMCIQLHEFHRDYFERVEKTL